MDNFKTTVGFVVQAFEKNKDRQVHCQSKSAMISAWSLGIINV